MPTLPQLLPPVRPEKTDWFGQLLDTTLHDGARLGCVRPLAGRPGGTGPWEGVEGANLQRVPEAATRQYFPSRGVFFSWGLPEAIPDKAYVTFRVEQNKNRGERDEFVVLRSTVELAVQVIDLGEDGFTPRVRDALARGTWGGPSVSCRRVLFRTGSEGFGPVGLVRTDVGYRIDQPEENAMIDYRPGVESGHASRVLTPEGTIQVVTEKLPAVQGVVFVERHEDAAERTLKRLRKVDRPLAEALGVTAQVFKTYVEAVANHAFSSARESVPSRFHAEHVEELAAVLSQDSLLMEEAIAVLRAQPDVAEALERERDEVRAAVRLEMEASLQEARSEVAAGREQVEALEVKRAALERDVEARRAALESEVQGYEAALGLRLRALAEEPARLFAEAAFVKAALGVVGGATLEAAGEAEGDGPAPQDGGWKAAEVLTKVDEAVTRLSRAVDWAGFSPSVGCAVLGALLARKVPVVTGPYAGDLLHAVADVVGGGQVAWVTVHPAWPRPEAWLETPLGEGWGPFSTLADLLAGAETLDRTFVVGLDGIDRAAVETFASSVFRVYADRRRRLVLATRGGARVVAWPSNVLLVATAELGATTFPLTPGAWAHGMLVPGPAERSEKPRQVKARTLTREAWREAEAAVFDEEFGLDAAPAWLRPEGVDRYAVGSVLAGMNAVLSPEEAQVATWWGGTLPALLAGGRDEVEAKAGEASLSESDRRRLEGLVARLLGEV